MLTCSLIAKKGKEIKGLGEVRKGESWVRI